MHQRPTWRKRGLHEGLCVRDTRVRKINRRWAEIVVPKCGRVRFRLSRPLPAGEIGMARVTLDRKGRWHVSLPGPQPAIAREPTGAMVGVDRGITATLATSDGRMLRAPVMRDRERARLTRLQRRLARQRKGSNRRRDSKQRIAGLQQTVADRRRNWIEVQTTWLVREHDLIAVERLNVKGMVRRPAPKPDPNQAGGFLPNGAAAKTGLNRSIDAQAWSLWQRCLEQKAAASGVRVHVDARNTSRRCPVCGHVAAENRESQAVFHCVACGHENNADDPTPPRTFSPEPSTGSRSPPDRGQPRTRRGRGCAAEVAHPRAQREPPSEARACRVIPRSRNPTTSVVGGGQGP